MDYSEITISTTSEASELVAYFMQEVCIDGVGIYDKKDFNSASWDYKEDGAEDIYGNETKVKGYCKVEDTESVLCFLREKMAALSNAGSLDITVGRVRDDDWVARWKETFRPIETSRMVICPEWLSVDTDKNVLLLDAGIAFGTGQHETTSMCISFAEDLCLDGKTVLDIGSGSGILGLAALKQGAAHATLIDIDRQAAEIAAHNAEINALTDRCEIICGDLTEKVGGVFDLVFANLTADILTRLYDGIGAVVRKGSYIILSGILDSKLAEVETLYGGKFRVVQTAEKGEWRALLLEVR